MRNTRRKRQPWMHTALNPDGIAQKQAEKKSSFSWETYTPPETWHIELARFFYQHLNAEDKIPEQEILKELKRHINQHSTPGVITSFTTIYAILLRKVTPEEAGLQVDLEDKEVISGTVSNIVEGLKHCAAGVYERIKTVCDRWEAGKSFPDMMRDFRTEIVGSLARSRFKTENVDPIMDTHRLDFYLVVANEGLNLNVRGATPGQNYPDKKDVNNIIAAAMQEKYRPIAMVQYIIARLRGNIPSILPTVPEKSDKDRTTWQYELTEHNDAFKTIAESLLDNLGYSDTQDATTLLLSDEKIILTLPEERMRVYTNINWEKVRELIQQQLFKKQILTSTMKPRQDREIFWPSFDNKDQIEYWLFHVANNQDITDYYKSLGNEEKKINFLVKVYTIKEGRQKLIATGMEKELQKQENYYIKKLQGSELTKKEKIERFSTLALTHANETEIKEVLSKLSEKSEFERISLSILYYINKDPNTEKNINSIMIQYIIEHGNREKIKEEPNLLAAVFSAADPSEYKEIISRLFPEKFDFSTLPNILSNIDKPNRAAFYNAIKETLKNRNKDPLSQMLEEDLTDATLSYFFIALRLLESREQIEVINSLSEKTKLDGTLKVKESFQPLLDILLSQLSAEAQKELLSNKATAEKILFLTTGNYFNMHSGHALLNTYLKTPEICYLFLKRIHSKFGLYKQFQDEENPKFIQLQDLLKKVDGANNPEAAQFVFEAFNNVKPVISYITPNEFVGLLRECPSLVTQFFPDQISEPINQALDSYITPDKFFELLRDNPSLATQFLPDQGLSELINEFFKKEFLSALEENPTLLPDLLEVLPNNYHGYVIEAIPHMEIITLIQTKKLYLPKLLKVLTKEDLRRSLLNLLFLFPWTKEFSFETISESLQVLSGENQSFFLNETMGRLRNHFEFMTTDELSELLKTLPMDKRFLLLNDPDVKKYIATLLSKDLTLLPLLPLPLILSDSNLKITIQKYIGETYTAKQILDLLRQNKSDVESKEAIQVLINNPEESINLLYLLQEPLFTSANTISDFFTILEEAYPDETMRATKIQELNHSKRPCYLPVYLKYLIRKSEDKQYEKLFGIVLDENISIILDEKIIKDARELASMLFAFNPDSEKRQLLLKALKISNEDLYTLVKKDPKHLTKLLNALPESNAQTLIRDVWKDFPTWFSGNTFGRPCQDLVTMLKRLPDEDRRNQLIEKLIRACGGINEITKKAFNVSDFLEVTYQLEELTEPILMQHITNIIKNEKDLHQLLNEIKKEHYPMILANCKEALFKTNVDFLHAVEAIDHPVKKLDFIRTIYNMSKKFLLENDREILGPVLKSLSQEKQQNALIEMFEGIHAIFRDLDRLKLATKYLPEKAQSRLNKQFLPRTPTREATSPHAVYEITGALSNAANDLEKSQLIIRLGIDDIAELVNESDELAELLEYFPEGAPYQIEVLTEENQHNLQKNTIYVFYDDGGGYLIKSPDGKETYRGDIEDIQLTEAQNQEWIKKNRNNIIDKVVGNHHAVYTNSKTDLIDKIGGVEKIIKLSENADPTTLAQISRHCPDSHKEALGKAISESSEKTKQMWEAAHEINKAARERKEPPAKTGFVARFGSLFHRRATSEKSESPPSIPGQSPKK